VKKLDGNITVGVKPAARRATPAGSFVEAATGLILPVVLRDEPRKKENRKTGPAFRRGTRLLRSAIARDR